MPITPLRELLKDRYDNTRSIVHAHLEDKSPVVRGARIWTCLKKLHKITNELLRTLQALGQPVKQLSAASVFCIVHKLDAQSGKLWQPKHLGKKVISMDAFSELLDERSRAIENGAQDASRASKISDQRGSRDQFYTASVTCSETGDADKLYARCEI